MPGSEKHRHIKRHTEPTGAEEVTDRVSRLELGPGQRWIGEVSGAFADLGTFLPLVLGAFAVQSLDPSGVLTGFGISALVVAIVYRRPIPVQPMKAVAALVIAGGLGATELAAAGVLLGFTLLVLGTTGMAGRLARLVPKTVQDGIQLGVGLYLVLAGLALAADAKLIAVIALGVLLLFYWTRLRPFAAILVVVGAAALGMSRTDALPEALAFGLWLPEFRWPDLASFWSAGQSIFLPQLALTITNAILVTAVVAAKYFPQDRDRISPNRLAVSTGGLNLLLAPFGAFPMCHGAGGLGVPVRGRGVSGRTVRGSGRHRPKRAAIPRVEPTGLRRLSPARRHDR